MHKLLTWLDRLHWLWLLLVAPFLLFPTPKRTPALLIVPVLWILRWFVARLSPASPHPSTPSPSHPNTPAPLPFTPLNSVILLIAIMVLVSTWATYDLAFSLPKISGMVLGLGVFFAITREARQPHGWWLSLLLFLAMGVSVAGLGLLGTNWFTTKISFLNPVTSRFPTLITGLQGAESGFHPNEVAGALTWVLPVLMILSLSFRTPALCVPSGRGEAISSNGSKILLNSPSPGIGRGGWGVRVIIWLSTLFVLAVFILTQSRGGYLAVAFTSLALLFIALPLRWRWTLLAGLVIAGLILGFVLSKEDLIAARDWLTGSGLTTEGALSLNTLEGRVEIWSRAIYGLQDFPFTGMGMNTFREVVHVLYPLFLIAPDVDFGHAHNEFLQAGLDLGIPGLIAFIAIYIGAFWMLAEVWKRTRNPCPDPEGSRRAQLLTPNSKTAISNLQRATVLGLGGGLAAHLLYGLTDAVALGAKPGVLFWMLLGLIAGLHNQVRTSVND